MHSQAQHSRPVSPPLQTAILLLTITFLLCAAVSHLWSMSSDLAHHYALVARLSQRLFTLPPGIDQSLGEMNIYPRNSHLLAAVLGRLIGSPLLGLHVVTLLSIITVWCGLAAIVLTLPRRAGLAATALMIAALILNRHYLEFEVFGNEVIGNYFYAQLVAQSFMVAALLASLYMERRGVAPLPRYLFTIVAIYAITGTHLLPAAQLVCVLLAQIALEFWQFLQQRPARWQGRAASGLACMLAAVVVMIKHPAYEAMKLISLNNGALTLHFFSSTPRIVWFCLLVVVLSGALLLQAARLQRRGMGAPYLALKYVGLFGLAATGLCLLQIVLLTLGHGSDYAIKKHMFTISSICLVELALLPACLPWLRRDEAPRAGIFYTYLALPLLTVVAFKSITHHHPSWSTSAVVRMEHLLELRRDLAQPPAEGQYVYTIDLPGMTNVANYMMTIGVFGTMRSANAGSVLENQAFTETGLVGTIITASESAYGQLSKCRMPGSTSELAIIDGVCAMKARQEGRPLIRLRVIDGQPPCTLVGFNQPETGGRWSEGKEVTVSCPVPTLEGKKAHAVTLDLHAFNAGGTSQRFVASVNGAPAQTFVFKPEQPVPTVTLLLPPGAERMELHVDLPDAISPQQLGLSGDTRQLGVILSALKFE